MEVEEPGLFHISQSTNKASQVILISDSMAEKYTMIHQALSTTIVENLDFGLSIDLPDLVDQLLGLMTLDLGPVSVHIGALAFVLGEICNRFIIRGYEIGRYPAKVGIMKVGMSKVGKLNYEIEPVDLNSIE